ncbi:MAG: response regulator [Pseudomonadota bacterium]
MAKKILVVDDELDTRVFVTTLLKSKGFKALSASDGLEGMEVARREKPNLIILDVMMPKESGFNMYRQLKNDPDLKAVPVIMLSALSRKAVFHSLKVLDEFMDEKTPDPEVYMEKPPDSEELLEAVQSHINPNG